MGTIRILVVDDSSVVRTIVSDVLSSEPGFEVVGVAPNGRLALDRFKTLQPDVVTLDVEMPEMNGLETLTELRKLSRTAIVVMLSSSTTQGAAATLEALSIGANDYVPKPAARSLELAMESLRTTLVPRIRQFFAARVVEVPRVAPPPPRPAEPSPARGGKVECVAIGASTGGPNALEAVMASLPRGFSVPIFITQHMPPVFTRMLADRLNARSPVRVSEAFDGAVVEPGTAWIAPGDFHMCVKRVGLNVQIQLNKQPPENSCRPAVDPMFRSLVPVYGGSILAVVLTGMGQDGTAGAGIIRRAGGQVVAQDQASSVVWGMPGSVAGANLANDIVPLDEIAGLITRRTMLARGGASAGRAAAL
jgi:two-component system chemotaxis response regulator CheB